MQMHTILLIQPTTRPDSRTYSDYETLRECLEGTDIYYFTLILVWYTVVYL